VQTFLSTPQIKPEELQTSEWISEEIETIRKEEISPPSNTPIKKKEDISSNEKPKTIEEIATIDTDIEIEDISIEVEDIIIEEVDEEAQIIEETTQEDIEELINILFETSDE
jgi:Fic family protein